MTARVLSVLYYNMYSSFISKLKTVYTENICILRAEIFELKRHFSIVKDCRHIQIICDIRRFLWFFTRVEVHYLQLTSIQVHWLYTTVAECQWDPNFRRLRQLNIMRTRNIKNRTQNQCFYSLDNAWRFLVLKFREKTITSDGWVDKMCFW